MKRRISSLITTIIFLAIVAAVLSRTYVHIWVQTSWWGLLIGGVVLFLIIDFAVARIFNNSSK